MPTTPTAHRIAANVRAEMARRNCTQERLATRLGKSQGYVSRRLVARIPFNTNDLDAIAKALDVPLSDLIGSEAVA